MWQRTKTHGAAETAQINYVQQANVTGFKFNRRYVPTGYLRRREHCLIWRPPVLDIFSLIKGTK